MYRLPRYEDLNLCSMKVVLSEELKCNVNIASMETERDVDKVISDLTVCIRKSALMCRIAKSVMLVKKTLRVEIQVDESEENIPSVSE